MVQAVALVSVITPTWSRQNKLLTRCVPSVQEQTYEDIEHIIVSDGPDELLRSYAFPANVRYYELPEHKLTNGRWGTKARLYGIEQSRGDYIAYLDDDDRYRPKHIEELAGLLDSDTETGFAYSPGLWMRNDDTTQVAAPFGNVPPAHGGIGTGTIMNRRSILEIATWKDDGVQVTIDWDLIERWLLAGVPYAYTPSHEAGVEFIPHPSEGFR